MSWVLTTSGNISSESICVRAQPRRHDGVGVARLHAEEAAVGLELLGPRGLGRLGQQPVDEHLRRVRVGRAIEEPDHAAGGLIVELRQLEGLDVPADAVGLEVPDGEDVEPDADRIPSAHHELAELVAVAAQHRLLVDQQLLHNPVAQLQPGHGQRPEGGTDHARVGDDDLPFPLRGEEVLDAPELALLHVIDVHEHAERTGEQEGVGEPVAVEKAGLETATPVGVVPGLGRDDRRADRVPDPGLFQHLERGARGDGCDVPGIDAGLALLEEAGREVRGFEVRVVELDLGMGPAEELENSRVALAGERVDRDLALLPGRRDRLMPLGRGRRPRGPAADGDGGGTPREATEQTAARNSPAHDRRP